MSLFDRISEIVPQNGLAQKLEESAKNGKPLTIKLGFDPTAPDLHLGHAVVLKKLREFQEAGHKVVVVIGGFTAMIGDPTGRNKMRPPLSREDVANNAQTYINQLDKILDVSKIEVRSNMEWIGSMDAKGMIELMSKMTLAQIMQRNDFSERFKAGSPVHLHELMYPLLQGYDSCVLNSDIEMGGTDQLFNCLVGRALQETEGSKSPQIVLVMPLLRGLDGVEKMSKSKNNYIGLTDAPEDMFGKTMSISDELLPEYVELTTDFSAEERADMIAALKNDAVNPMEIKKKVAKNIVTQYHNAEAADAAEEHFKRQVQSKSLDEKEFQDVKLADLGLADKEALTILDVASALQPTLSKSEIRRLAQGGGLTMNNEKVADAMSAFPKEDSVKLKIGKRALFNVIG